MPRSVLSFLRCCTSPPSPEQTITPSNTNNTSSSTYISSILPSVTSNMSFQSSSSDLMSTSSTESAPPPPPPPLQPLPPAHSLSSVTPSSSTTTSPTTSPMSVSPADSPSPEDIPRYSSWSAVVRNIQNPQPRDLSGNVISYAPSFPRRLPPSLLPDPLPPPSPFYLPPPAPVPFPVRRRIAVPSLSSSSSLGSSSNLPLPLSSSSVTLLHLPNEVLDLIIIYLSSYPNSAEPLWDNVTDIRNAMAFSLTCVRIHDLFRARLVAIRTRPERYREDLLYSPPVAGVVVDARTSSDISNFASVLRLSGPSLRELLVTKNIPGSKWVDAYVANVSALKKLSLRDVKAEYPLERILQTSARTLRELEIVGATGMALSESQLLAMGTYCSSVTHLSLRLSMFDHDWTCVWMGIGPGLIRLSLGATRFWIMDTEEDELLEQIGRYCVDLKQLHFYHLGPTLGPACARLCTRYGDQLESLELEQSQMLRADLDVLARGCRNTAFSISHGSSLFSHAYNVDVIDLLGDQIISLRYRSQLAHDESLWEVGKKCPNLRELKLDCASTLTEAALEGILKGVGENLERLSLSFFVRGLERALVGTALNVMANVVSELRELHLGGQKFDVGVFANVVGRCRNTLTKVSITFGFRTAGEREVVEASLIVGLIQSLYVCKELRTLQILDRTRSDRGNDWGTVREAAWKLRGWATRVSICGIDYIK